MTGRHHSEQLLPSLYLLGSLPYSNFSFLFTQCMYLLGKCFRSKVILFNNG